MRRPPRRRAASLAAIFALTLVTSGCVADHVAAPAAGEDMRGLMADADREARALRTRGDMYEDASLDAYLAGIVDRLLGEGERATDVRPITVTVLRDPTLNAFALPTGDIFVHTGLLARMEDEVQLAMILARELTHVSLGHGTTRPPRKTRVDVAAIARTIGMAAASPAGNEDTAVAGLSPVFRIVAGQPLAVSYAAAVDGYGTAAARAADAGAMGRLARASHDVKDGARVLDRLRRAARAGGAIERFFYGNDAALADSVRTIARLAGADGAGASDAVASRAVDAPSVAFRSERSDDPFALAMIPVVRENVALEVSAGRFRLAQEQVDRVVAFMPGDARAHLMAGELYRLRAQRTRSVADRDELARQALTSYQRCLELDPGVAEVQRGLGLLYYHFGQRERAREAFTRYVTLRPDAPDVARVREYLAEP